MAWIDIGFLKRGFWLIRDEKFYAKLLHINYIDNSSSIKVIDAKIDTYDLKKKFITI